MIKKQETPFDPFESEAGSESASGSEIAAFYSLAEVEKSFGIGRREITEKAAKGEVVLCVPVPPDGEVFCIDPYSIATRDPFIEQNRFILRRKADEANGMPARPGREVIALAVSPRDCGSLLSRDFLRAELFDAGYVDLSGMLYPTTMDTIWLSTPARVPLFDENGPTDQAHWRFAVYPAGIQFSFTAGVGYQGPSSIELTPDGLRIAGKEVKRLIGGKGNDQVSTSSSSSVQGADGDLPTKSDLPALNVSLGEPRTERPKRTREDPIRELLMNFAELKGYVPSFEEAMKHFKEVEGRGDIREVDDLKEQVVYRCKNGDLAILNKKKLCGRLANLRKSFPDTNR